MKLPRDGLPLLGLAALLAGAEPAPAAQPAPLLIALSADPGAPGAGLDAPARQAIADAVADRFARVEGLAVDALFCGAAQPCPPAPGAVLAVRLGAPREGRADGGLSIRFAPSDPRAPGKADATVLPIACALSPAVGGPELRRQVNQGVNPGRLARPGKRAETLARHLHNACHGLLAATPGVERSYAANPEVYLERRRAVAEPPAAGMPAAGMPAAEPPAAGVPATTGAEGARAVLHTPEAEVTLGFGNNGLNR